MLLIVPTEILYPISISFCDSRYGVFLLKGHFTRPESKTFASDGIAMKY